MNNIRQIFNAITPVAEPLDIPFPQADSMVRLINLLWQLNGAAGGQLSPNQIMRLQSFTDRQVNYYTDAGRYLGLIEKLPNGSYQLSQNGHTLLAKPQQDLLLELVRLILSHRVFYDAFQLRLNTGILPAKNTVANLIQAIRPELRSNKTHMRRASTVLRWLEWILALCP